LLGKNKLDHIGIAVKDLGTARLIYENLGLLCSERESIEEQKVEVEIFPAGETTIELLEPTSSDSPIAKFISKKGEGLHHIALEVQDIKETLKKCSESGLRLIDKEPRIGAGGHLIAFLHPITAGGVLIELTQKQK